MRGKILDYGTDPFVTKFRQPFCAPKVSLNVRFDEEIIIEKDPEQGSPIEIVE